MASPNVHVDRDLDVSNAGRGVWLVKVCMVIVVVISVSVFSNQGDLRAHQGRNMPLFRRIVFTADTLCSRRSVLIKCAS
jgi:hypothetical protein